MILRYSFSSFSGRVVFVLIERVTSREKVFYILLFCYVISIGSLYLCVVVNLGSQRRFISSWMIV